MKVLTEVPGTVSWAERTILWIKLMILQGRDYVYFGKMGSVVYSSHTTSHTVLRKETDETIKKSTMMILSLLCCKNGFSIKFYLVDRCWNISLKYLEQISRVGEDVI